MNKRIIVIIALCYLTNIVPSYSMSFWPFNSAKVEQKIDIQEPLSATTSKSDWCIVEKADSSSWHDINLAQLSIIFGNDMVVNIATSHKAYGDSIGIRRAMEYIPNNVNLSAKPLALFVIHGTWAAVSNDYFEEDRPLFQAALKLGEQLAEQHCAPIKVISFKWTGYNTQHARATGGHAFAQIIKNKYFDEHTIITYAHSHGGNVVNYASTLLSNNENKIIEIIINVGTPIVYVPENFQLLLSFYSTGDLVQSVGAFQLGMQYNIGLRKYIITSKSSSNTGYRNIGRVVNIRTQVKGEDPDHSALNAYVLFELSPILNQIQTIYKNHNDLYVNIDQDKIKRILLTIYQPLSSEIAQEIECQDQLVEERFISKLQELLFKRLYNRPIEQKSDILLNIKNLKKTLSRRAISNQKASDQQTNNENKCSEEQVSFPPELIMLFKNFQT